MRIPAKLCLSSIPYAEMCENEPNTKLLYPTEEIYDFSLGDILDVFITDICTLNIDSPAGIVYKRYLDAGICAEEDLRVLESIEGYIVDFATREIDQDKNLADYNGTWYPKDHIKMVC